MPQERLGIYKEEEDGDTVLYLQELLYWHVP